MRWGTKRYGTLETRFWSHVSPEPNSGCWLWDGPVDDFGYGRLREGRDKIRAHQLSARLHGRALPNGLIWRHCCDMPGCVNPDHLVSGTLGDNNRDRMERGRNCEGERVHSAKLTAQQVIEIAEAPGTHRAIAARYGVSHNRVGAIKRRQGWRSVLNV